MEKKSLYYKLAILSISLVLVTGSSISAALPSMQASLGEISTAGINLIATIPQAGVLLFLLLSNWFVDRMGMKNTILLGLIIMGFAGIVPIFTNNYGLILFSRFFFGAGIGLYNSLAITIINLSFNGEEQSKLLGFRGSMESIGASIASILVGFLLPFGWQTTFLIYALAFPIALYFYKIVPQITIPQNNKTQTSFSTDYKIYLLAFIFLILVMVQIMIMLQIPPLVLERHITTASGASNLVALNTFSGMIGGALFGWLYQKLDKIAFPSFLLGDALGLLLMVNAHSLIIIIIATSIIGLFGTLMCVSIFNLMADITTPAEQDSANTILLIGANVGSFTTPFWIQGAQQLLGANAYSPILFCAYLLIAISFIFILIRKAFQPVSLQNKL